MIFFTKNANLIIDTKHLVFEFSMCYNIGAYVSATSGKVRIIHKNKKTS